MTHGHVQYPPSQCLLCKCAVVSSHVHCVRYDWTYMYVHRLYNSNINSQPHAGAALASVVQQTLPCVCVYADISNKHKQRCLAYKQALVCATIYIVYDIYVFNLPVYA